MPLPTCTPDVNNFDEPAGDDFIYCIAAEMRAIKVAFNGIEALRGQCRLVKSGSNLVLQPFNGNKLTVDGAVRTIPAAGVSLAATGLTANTNYYIYAYMNSGTLTLKPSLTGHATDATTGAEVKSDDSSCTLVGFARVISGPAWQDTNSQRFVRSWFNDAGISGRNTPTTAKTTTSTSYVAISTAELRVEFLAWAGEKVQAAFSGVAHISADNQYIRTALYLNGAPASSGFAMHSRAGFSILSYNNHHVSMHDDLSEGYSFVDVYGKVDSGIGTWICDVSPNRSGISFQVIK